MQMGSFPRYPKDIEGVLIDNRDGKKVAILVNPNDHGCQAQIEVDGKLWYIELYADSVFTIEIEA